MRVSHDLGIRGHNKDTSGPSFESLSFPFELKVLLDKAGVQIT